MMNTNAMPRFSLVCVLSLCCQCKIASNKDSPAAHDLKSQLNFDASSSEQLSLIPTPESVVSLKIKNSESEESQQTTDVSTPLPDLASQVDNLKSFESLKNRAVVTIGKTSLAMSLTKASPINLASIKQAAVRVVITTSSDRAPMGVQISHISPDEKESNLTSSGLNMDPHSQWIRELGISYIKDTGDHKIRVKVFKDGKLHTDEAFTFQVNDNLPASDLAVNAQDLGDIAKLSNKARFKINDGDAVFYFSKATPLRQFEFNGNVLTFSLSAKSAAANVGIQIFHIRPDNTETNLTKQGLALNPYSYWAIEMGLSYLKEVGIHKIRTRVYYSTKNYKDTVFSFEAKENILTDLEKQIIQDSTTNLYVYPNDPFYLADKNDSEVLVSFKNNSKYKSNYGIKVIHRNPDKSENTLLASGIDVAPTKTWSSYIDFKNIAAKGSHQVRVEYSKAGQLLKTVTKDFEVLENVPFAKKIDHSRMKVTVNNTHAALQLNPLPPFNIGHAVEAVLEVHNNSKASVTHGLTVVLDRPTQGKMTLVSSGVTVAAYQKWSTRARLPKFDAVGKYKLKMYLSNPAGGSPIRSVFNFEVRSEGYGTTTLNAATVAWFDPITVMSGAMTRTPNPKYSKLGKPDVGDIYEDYIKKVVQNMFDVGVRTIIYSYADFGGVAYYNSALTAVDYQFFGGFQHAENQTHPSMTHWAKGTYNPVPRAGSDMLKVMLEMAEDLGMSVIVGLGRDEDIALPNDLYTWLVTSGGADFKSENNGQYMTSTGMYYRISRAIELSKKKVNDLLSKYGRHNSFVGFYLNHEAHDILPVLEHNYRPVSAYIKMVAPTKLVMVSPLSDPSILPGDRTSLLPSYIGGSDVDIWAWQDSVGVGLDLDGKSTYNPYIRIAVLPTVFAKYYSWISGANSYSSTYGKGLKTLWANNEAWEMDGTANFNGSSYTGSFPAAYGRLAQQSSAVAPYVTAKSLYEFSQNFSATDDPFIFGKNVSPSGTCGMTGARCQDYGQRASWLLACYASTVGIFKFWKSGYQCYY